MITTTKDSQEVQRPTAEGGAIPVKESKQTLADLAQLICEDATKDSLFYLLRSNTSHDGE